MWHRPKEQLTSADGINWWNVQNEEKERAENGRNKWMHEWKKEENNRKDVLA